MKIIFAGTPEFAAKHLNALLEAGIEIQAVLTRPDKPSGRGQKLQPSPVKLLAESKGLPVHQPTTLKDQAAEELIRSFDADVIIDVAYGVIIPKNILEIPKFGFINVHPSLLPRWRGPAPIQHAILAGDQDTGVTIMKLDEGVDTGPIYLQKTYHIQPHETSATLHEHLAKLGSNALITVLKRLEADDIKVETQQSIGITYAPKIEKPMAAIHWSHSAYDIERMIRAFNDWPVAFSNIGDTTIRIWEANPISNYTSETSGTIIRITPEGIDVATGDGILRIQRMQFPGGKALPVSEILKSKKEFFEKHARFG